MNAMGRIILVAVIVVSGCQTVPKPDLRLTQSALEIRQFQSHKFDATSEQEILMASVGVLQDMDYNIDAVELPLGVLSASKTIDASSGGEMAGLILIELLCAMGGGSCGAMETASESQTIMLTLVVLPTLAEDGSFVTRVTLQRIVWDKQGRAKLRETIDDAEGYQQFFNKLSKSIFLEANSI
jgi:hypothetical protein